MVSKRPRIVTFLALGVLIYTGFYWTRFYQAAFSQKTFLEDLPLPFSPTYLQATGLIFGLLGLLCFVGLWWGFRWGPLATQALAAITGLFIWADRILLADPGPGLRNWPFALGLTIFILGYLFVVFRSEDVRYFFGPVPPTALPDSEV